MSEQQEATRTNKKSFASQRSEHVRAKNLRQKKEKNLLVIFLALSALAHFSIFYIKPEIKNIQLEREQAVEVDLDNFILKKPAKPRKVVAIKKQKVAPEATVPSNMLPQLAKKTKVEKKPKKAVVVSKKKAKEKEKKPEKQKKDEKLKKPKANTLKENELKKRLALEKLRNAKDVKKSKELTVQSDKQNKIDEDALKLKQQELNLQREEAKAPCMKFVKQFVQPMIDEQLPVKYQFGDKMTVDYLIIADEDLSIKKIAMETTSGDEYFDKIVENAILASAPLPEPCKPFAGTQIRIRFSSNTH